MYTWNNYGLLKSKSLVQLSYKLISDDITMHALIGKNDTLEWYVQYRKSIIVILPMTANNRWRVVYGKKYFGTYGEAAFKHWKIIVSTIDRIDQSGLNNVWKLLSLWVSNFLK